MHGATCCVLASLLLLDTGLALEFPISAFVRYVDGLRTASAANLLLPECFAFAVSLLFRFKVLHPADGGSQVGLILLAVYQVLVHICLYEAL